PGGKEGGEPRAPSPEPRFLVSSFELRDERIDLLELQASWRRRRGRAAGGPPAVVVFERLRYVAPSDPLLDQAGQAIPHRLEIGSEFRDVVFGRDGPMAG